MTFAANQIQFCRHATPCYNPAFQTFVRDGAFATGIGILLPCARSEALYYCCGTLPSHCLFLSLVSGCKLHYTTLLFAPPPPPLLPSAMSYYAWITRCVPAFSICAVAILLVLALIVQPHGREEEGKYNGETTWAQLVLSVYTVLLHIMSIAFPLRVCWSMIDMNRRMKDAAALMPNIRRRRAGSVKSDEGDFTFPVPLFVIIIPAYKEEVETLEMTLRVLASHSQARHCYHVCHPS